MRGVLELLSCDGTSGSGSISSRESRGDCYRVTWEPVPNEVVKGPPREHRASEKLLVS